MHVNPWFLSREKVKPVLPVPEYRRTHRRNLSNVRPAHKRSFWGNDSAHLPPPDTGSGGELGVTGIKRAELAAPGGGSVEQMVRQISSAAWRQAARRSIP